MRFGRLIAIRPAGRKRSYVTWDCDCDCGEKHNATSGSLLRGTTKSCGCLWRELHGKMLAEKRCGKWAGRDSLIGIVNSVYRSYKRGASTRGHEFKLSLVEFSRLTSLPCEYCGIGPSNRMTQKSKSKYWHVTPSVLSYNGIDRSDSSIGYVPGNCVPCCATCNIAKHTMGIEAFKDWVSRAHDHMFGGATCRA